MSVFKVESFKFGLDSRRDVLTSVVGTLFACENGFVNQGGEIEKRKKFDLPNYGESTFDNQNKSITSITSVGLLATATSANHSLVTGEFVQISGANEPQYNGIYEVTVLTVNTFTYVITSSIGFPATGTLILAYTGTFGLEGADVGLVVFGSALNFGASASQGQPTLASALTTVVYQQLKHPSLANDSAETYDLIYHRMVSVVFSDNFNGKTFACAKFSDGRRYLYFDGTLVPDSADGLVLEGRTSVTDLAEDLVRELATVDYNTELNVDEFGVAQAGSVIAKSQPGDFFKPLPTETSVLGYIGEKIIPPQNVAAVSAVKAIASFQVTAAAAGTLQLTAPNQASATTPTIDLGGGPIAATGNTVTTADAIVRAVNDFTSVHGYSAQTNTLDSVFVYAPAGYDIPVGLSLTVTEVGGATTGPAGASPASLSAIISPNPAVNDLLLIGRRSPADVPVTVNVIAVGGTVTTGYTYEWSVVSGDIGFYGQPVGPTATCGAQLFNDTREGVVRCLVKDNATPKAEVTALVSIKVSMSNTPPAQT